MAFGSFNSGNRDQPMTEINMVPMIDIMLVLLIIFIVTAPMMTHAVKVELPKVSSTPHQQKADAILISIDAASAVYWNGVLADDAELQRLLQEASSATVQPELHLSIARQTPYERVAKVMSFAAQKGLNKIAFITEPLEAP